MAVLSTGAGTAIMNLAAPALSYEDAMILVYEEFGDFIAAGTTPETVIAFRPSEAAQSYVAD